MSRWKQRVGALFGRRDAPSEAARVASPAKVPAGAASMTGEPAAGEDAVIAVDLREPFFEWVIGAALAPSDVLLGFERELIAHLDAVLDSDDSRSALLPRAPAVIPQLLNSLRNEDQSTTALAEHVMRDPHLVAEVISISVRMQLAADVK